eukprot:5803056-Amphidinium_carterae.1
MGQQGCCRKKRSPGSAMIWLLSQKSIIGNRSMFDFQMILSLNCFALEGKGHWCLSFEMPSLSAM